MNERNLKVLEQYDLEVRNVRKGRGSYIIDTDKGLVLLKEYNGSKQRGEWMEQVCRIVKEAGLHADSPIANKEGACVSTDRDERRYMLKNWTYGREIDVKDMKDIKAAVKNLAKLHKALQGFEYNEITATADMEQIFTKRMREIRKIQRYVKDKKRKNSFEMDFLKQYEAYFEMCTRALELAGRDNMKFLQQKATDAGRLCHGDYNQHNILKEDSRLVTVNFENCRIGSQTEDLYNFMRKIMEKNNWELSLADEMLDGYMTENKLLQEELELIYIQFLFSEKFWKIANHYYNTKKTWIPDRSLQKLDNLVHQSEARQKFLDYFYQKYV